MNNPKNGTVTKYPKILEKNYMIQGFLIFQCECGNSFDTKIPFMWGCKCGRKYRVHFDAFVSEIKENK